MLGETRFEGDMKFSHPLARGSQFWHVESLDDGSQEVFVVMTTLELKPDHKRFKREKVERLRVAARVHLRDHAPNVRKILIMNPLKV